MPSQTNLVSPQAVLAPVGTPEARAQALRSLFGPQAGRAAIRFAIEAYEMGEEDAALAWMKAASFLVDEGINDETAFLH